MIKTAPKILLYLLAFLAILIFPKNVLAAASLSFSPASGSYSVGTEFNVNIILNTGDSNTDGVDVVIKYDGNKLQYVSNTYGSLYANTFSPNTATSGQVILRATTATTSPPTYYKGTGTFSTVKFKAIAAGTANLYFDFTSGSTVDSNVAYQGEDILGSVSNASYTIGAGGVGGSSPSPSPSVPVSGTTTPTVMVLILGLGFFFFGTAKILLKF
jgi:hypothetical protein